MPPPVDTAYYVLLDVQPDATPEQLTTAYRKKALQLHPDKGGNPEEFKAMKAAYDVLKDPDKRKTYDQYGPMWVRAMEGEVLDPEVMKELMLTVMKQASKILLCMLPFIAAAVLFPAIGTALKWDHQVSWNWLVVISPIWLIQALALALVVKMRFALSRFASSPTDMEFGEDDDEAAREAKKLETKKILTTTIVVLSALILLEIFLCLKLQGYVNITWLEVLIPYLVVEALYLRARLGSPGRLTALWWGMLRISSASLAAARAGGQLSCSFMLCATPLIIGAVLKVLLACQRPAPPSNPEEPQEPVLLLALCSVSGWLATLCLGAGKLDGEGYSAFLVMMPYLLGASTALCCCACLACCAPTVMQAAMDHEQQGDLSTGLNANNQYGTMPERPAPPAQPLFTGGA